MATRIVDVLAGFETSTPPTTSDPVSDSDAVNKGYADATYTPRSNVYGVASDVTEAKAIASAARFDEQILYVASKSAFYEFDAGSSATGDDDLVLEPDAGTGRWIKPPMGGGSGGSGAAGVDALEQKGFAEHAQVFTPPLASSISESFAVAPFDVQLWLMEDYVTPATSIAAVVNPTWLSTSNKNFDGVTDWTAFDAEVGNINTEATTKKLGTNALSFDKNGGASVTAGVYLDLTAALAVNLASHTECWMYVNMPSVTNFSSFKLRIAGVGETDVTTNYREYTVTLNAQGGAIATGWNLLKFNIAVGQGTAFGTGYTVADLARVVGLFVITSSAAQTYTNVVVDSWVFNLTDYAKYAQVGDVFQIYNTSDQGILQIDNSSTASRGLITLTAAVGDNYAGGTASTAKRSNLSHALSNLAKMVDGLSGEIADKQTFITKTILPAQVTAADFDMSVSQYSDLFHTVSDVDSTTQIKVTNTNATDYSAQFLSGDKYFVFEVVYAQGRPHYAYRGLKLTLSGNSTFGSSKLTLQNSGTNSGVAVGDLIVKEELDAYLSCVATTDDESFGSALAQTTVLLQDVGMPYPGEQYVYGHWRLGGTNGLVNLKGPAANLAEIGGPTNRGVAFQNSFLGAGPFVAATDRFALTQGTASQLVGDAAAGFGVFSLSFWFNPISVGLGEAIMSHATSNVVGSSWWLVHLGSGNVAIRASGDTTIGTITAGSIPNGSWNHVVIVWDDGVELRHYANGVKTIGTLPTHTSDAANSQFSIGGSNAGNGGSAETSYLADVIAWSGYKLTDSDVLGLYRNGLGGGLTSRLNSLRHRYEKTGLTGKKLSTRVDLKRWTDAVNPQIDFVGAIVK